MGFLDIGMIIAFPDLRVAIMVSRGPGGDKDGEKPIGVAKFRQTIGEKSRGQHNDQRVAPLIRRVAHF